MRTNLVASKDTSHKPVSYRKVILIFLFITLIGLQIGAASIRSFWEDEAYTAWLTTKDIKSIIESVHTELNPPLYWLSVSIWSKAFGTSELGLKSFSILWLVAACLLTYKVSKDLFGESEALVAVGILAFSPFVLTYGHNARYYSMSAALSLLLFILVDKYVRTNSLRYLVMYVLAGTGLLYTIYSGAMVLLALNIWWIIQWIRSNRKYSHLIAWALAQFFSLLFFIPWISILISTLHGNFPTELGVSNWLTGIFLRVGYLGYAFGVGEFISPLNPIFWLGMFIISGLFILALLKGKQNLLPPLIILVFAGIFGIGYSLLGLKTVSYWQELPNRSFFMYPFFVMILAYGIIKLKGKWKWGLLIGLLVVYCGGIFNYFTDREAVKPILTVPWRAIMVDIQKQSTNPNVVICSTEDFACSYYQTRYGFEPFSPADWASISIQKPSEIWWIQSNLSNNENSIVASTNNIKSLLIQYREIGVYNYAPQDGGIGWLKSKYLGYASNPYRVVVFRFALP